MAYPTSSQIQPLKAIRPIQAIKPITPIQSLGQLGTPTVSVKTPWVGVYLPTPDPVYNAQHGGYSQTYAQKKSNWDYRKYMAENRKRSDLFFDYNNKNEVNSIADVILNTAANFSKAFGENALTIPEVIEQMGKDTWEFIYRGTIRPLAEGDATALMNNALINMGETVDIIDNTFWKSFVIGKQKYGSAAEGFRRAFYERENFDWDTGHKGRDLLLEVMTPFQIASLGLGAFAKGGIKTGLKGAAEVGSTAFNKSQIRTISRATKLGRSMDDIIIASQKAAKFDSSQLEFLKNVKVQSTGFKVTKAINAGKLPVQILDEVGPRLVYGSAFMPLKVTFKAGAKGINPVWKSIMQQLDRAEFTRSFTDGVMNVGKMKETYMTLAAAAEDAGEPARLLSVSDTVTRLARRDINKIIEQLRTFNKAFNDKRALDKIYDAFDGKLSLEEATAMHMDKTFKLLSDDMNVLIKEISGGAIETFDEYIDMVNKFYIMHPEDFDLSELFKTVSSVRNLRDSRHLVKFKADLRVLRNKIDIEIKPDETPEVNPNELFMSYKVESEKHLAELYQQQASVTKQLQELEVKLNDPIAYSQNPSANASLDRYVKEQARITEELKTLETSPTKEAMQEQLNKLDQMIENAKKLELEDNDFASIRANIDKAYRRLSNIDKPGVKTVDELRKIEEVKYEISWLEELLSTRNLKATRDALERNIKFYDRDDVILELQEELSELAEAIGVLKDMGADSVDNISREWSTTAKALRKEKHEIDGMLNRALDEMESTPDLHSAYRLHRGEAEDVSKALDKLMDKLFEKEGIMEGDLTLVLMSLSETIDNVPAYMKDAFLTMKEEVHALYNKVASSRYHHATESYDAEIGKSLYSDYKDLLDSLTERMMDDAFNDLMMRASLEKHYTKAFKDIFGDVGRDDIIKKFTASKGVETHASVETAVLEAFGKEATSELDIGKLEEFMYTLADDIGSVFKKFNSDINIEGLAKSFKDISNTGMDVVENVSETLEALVERVLNLKIVHEGLEATVETKAVKARGLSGVVDEISTIMDELEMTREYIVLLRRSMISSSDDVKRYAEVGKDLLDMIDGVITSMPAGRLYSVEYTVNDVRSYMLNLPSYIRTFYILGLDNISKVLDDVKFHNDTPMMQVLDTIATNDLGDLQNIKMLLSSTDTKNLAKAAELYMERTGKAMPESAQALTEVTDLLSELTTLKDSANHVKSVLEAMVSHSTFLNVLSSVVEEGVISKELAGHFYDAMHSFYSAPAELMDPAMMMTRADQVTFWKNKIMDNLSQQLRGKDLKHNFRLENAQHFIRDAFNKGEITDPEVADFIRRFPSSRSAHTSAADVEADYLLKKHWLGKELEEANLYMDMETASLNPETATSHQVALFNPVTKENVLYLNTNISAAEGFTSDNLYWSMYASAEDVKAGKFTMDELKEIYNSVHRGTDQDKAVDTFRLHFGIGDDVKIIACDGEEALLSNVSEHIKGQTAPGGKVKLSMYNGTAYDRTVMNTRMKKYDIPFRIREEQVIDHLKELEAKEGVRVLTEKEQDKLSQLLDNYIDIRRTEINNLVDSGVRVYDLEENIDDVLEITTKRTFLPSIDESFRDALDEILNYTDNGKLQSNRTKVLEDGVTLIENPLAKNEDLMDAINKIDLGDASSVGNRSQDLLFKDLKTLRQETQEILQEHIQKTNKLLNETVITTENMHKLVGEDFWKGIMGEKYLSSKGNVQVILKQLHAMEGIEVPVVNVATKQNSNHLLNWFAPGKRKFSQNTLKRMRDLAKNLDRTMERIKDVPRLMADVDGDPDQAYEIYKEISDELYNYLTKYVNMQYFSPALASLKTTDNLYSQYAIATELYSMLKAVDGTKRAGLADQVFKAFTNKYPKSMENVARPKWVFTYNYSKSNTALFHKYSVINENAETAIDYLIKRTRDNIKGLEAFEELKDTHVHVAKLQRMATIYEPMLKSFEIVEDMVNEMAEGMLRAGKSAAMGRADLYAKLRMPFEAAESYVAYNKMHTVLNMKPDDLVNFMWHWARGKITFKYSDLRSSSYFMDRNGIKGVDYILSDELVDVFEEMLKNKGAYEKLGMIFKVDGDRVVMALDRSFIESFKKLEFRGLPDDFNVKAFTDMVMKDYADRGVELSSAQLKKLTEALHAMADARLYLQKLSKDGMTSTLERFDSATYEMMESILPTTKGGMSVQDLAEHRMFDGNMFNHSILGSIDSRRELMEFASFNPAKTMFSAAQMMSEKLDSQAQFAEMMFSDLWKLSKVAEGMDDADILEYFRTNRHMRLTFLHTHKTDGFRMAAVNLYSIKDIEWAKKMGAVVMDQQTYVKTYEIVNKNMIPTGIMKVLQKFVVVPYKIGWLAWNYATVLRNLFDSGMKNVVTSQDAGMFKYMFDAFGMFNQYKGAMKEITELTRTTTGGNLDKAIAKYFKDTPNPKINKLLFDRISEFQASGSSAGMTQELIDYYGDAIDRLFRNNIAKGKTNLGNMDKAEFRKFVIMNDVEARAWLDMRYIAEGDDILKRQLMDIRSDRLFWKRAYEMKKIYRGKDLSVDDIFNYIKLGRKPAFVGDFDAVIKDLMHETRDVTLKKRMFDKIMDHPLVAHSLTPHRTVEEILRLALYNYMLDNNHTTSKALSEVIRTHFDYGHKTKGLMYGEMFFPFITFRYNSMLYWLEELGRHPDLLKLVVKSYKEASNLEDRDPEDIIMRRNLQYQMFTGNIIVNAEKGISMKLNASVIDIMKFFSAPATYATNAPQGERLDGYLPGGLNSVIPQIKYAFTMEPYTTETEEEFKIRQWKAYTNLIPLLGPQLARLKAFPEQNPIFSWMLAPLIGRTWTPEYEEIQVAKRKAAYKGSSYNSNIKYLRPLPSRYNSYTKSYRSSYTPRPKYIPRYYPSNYSGYGDHSNYSAFSRAYYGAQNRMSRGSVFPTKNSRSLNTAFSQVWRRSMTKAGNPKYKFLSFPTNKWTLQLKINILRNVTSYNRWQ